LVTVAVSCCVWPPYNVAVAGLTLTVTGGYSVTVADPDFDVSAWLVAVTVTVWGEVTVVGAVYSPVELIEPTPAGLMDHVTAVFASFTVAVNCWVWPAFKELVAGETLTVIPS